MIHIPPQFIVSKLNLSIEEINNIMKKKENSRRIQFRVDHAFLDLIDRFIIF